MENERKKKVKILTICFSIILGCLFVVGATQTFILKSKQNTLNNLQSQNSQLEREQSRLEEEEKYKESSDYVDDYYKNEEGYGNDGDKIIETK